MKIEEGIDDETHENNFPPLYVVGLISCLEDDKYIK